jgi:hypothetical protein
MLSFIRAIKFAAIIGVAAATLAAGSTASRAESGAVRLHIVKAGLIVGVGVAAVPWSSKVARIG